MRCFGIGVAPPPPHTPAEELGLNQLGRIWQDAAIAPATYRTLATLLLDLAEPARRQVAEWLRESAVPPDGEDEEQRKVRKIDMLMRLLRLDDSELDKQPSRAVIGVNIEVPRQTILDAVEKLVSQWKHEQGVSERRRRLDMYGSYLKAWDLREGWAGSSYSLQQERSWDAIAGTLSEHRSTVHDWHKAGFQLITGHSYTFDHWFRLFMVDKLTGPEMNKALSRRHVSHSPRGPAQVSEAVLRKAAENRRNSVLDVDDGGFSLDFADDLLDIKIMIEKGLDDKAIAHVVQPVDPNALHKLLSILRERHDDERPPQK